ncbi:nuclear transport factor 2 family protein [Stenotrophomonas maltophilia]|uniref:nuclear transport factor 2 family protein n=1 Tax=Stenotrophomonas maltophilia TaxID=40324 RepID=UPI004056C7D9
MERDIVEDLHERQLAALEQRLRQALLDDDHDALTALVSPALFMMDGQGGRLLDLPWLGDWLAGNLQARSLQSYAVETLLCGRLALLSSDVRLSVRGQGRERELKLRLLRVWTCSSGESGAQLLSMAVLAA